MHPEQQCPGHVEAGERFTNTVHMHTVTLREGFNFGNIAKGVFLSLNPDLMPQILLKIGME